MSYEKKNNATILVAISVIALALVATTNFYHSYMAFAAPKKGDSSSDSTTRHTNGVSTLGGSSSSSESFCARSVRGGAALQ